MYERLTIQQLGNKAANNGQSMADTTLRMISFFNCEQMKVCNVVLFFFVHPEKNIRDTVLLYWNCKIDSFWPRCFLQYFLRLDVSPFHTYTILLWASLIVFNFCHRGSLLGIFFKGKFGCGQISVGNIVIRIQVCYTTLIISAKRMWCPYFWVYVWSRQWTPLCRKCGTAFTARKRQRHQGHSTGQNIRYIRHHKSHNIRYHIKHHKGHNIRYIRHRKVHTLSYKTSQRS